MKRAKTPTKPKETLSLADNPSLIQAGEEIHLRVLDDFFIEQDLPKWKQFEADWKALKEQLKARYDDEVMREINKLEDPKQQEEYRKRLDSYKKGKRKIDDDRWDIKGKHERSVAESTKKTVRLAGSLSLKDKFLIKFGFRKAPVPVEVAFEDLKSHLLHTTTEAMAEKKAILDTAEKKFRSIGQINKANQIKAYTDQVIEEQALVAAGFTTYVTEEMMINFISKSERGVMVDFLRYYEGMIPDEVAELKKKADATMIFDNYVVAYYSDIKKVAKKIEKKEKKEEAKKVIERRRDPILFGLIKESRKLFFIADWVTETDDLTLKVLEEALGQKGLKLDDPAQVDTTFSGDMAIENSPIVNTQNLDSAIRQFSNNEDSMTSRSFYYSDSRSGEPVVGGGTTTYTRSINIV